MPIRHEIDPQRKFARVFFTGDIRVGEVWPGLRELFSDAAYTPGVSLLLDASQVGHVSVTNHEVQALAERVATFEAERRGTRVGFLAPADPAVVRLISAYVAIRSGSSYTIEVFTDPAACEAFVLGEPSDS